MKRADLSVTIPYERPLTAAETHVSAARQYLMTRVKCERFGTAGDHPAVSSSAPGVGVGRGVAHPPVLALGQHRLAGMGARRGAST